MKVDLKEIIRVNKLDKHQIAQMLFPKHKHNYKGMQRIFADGGELKASQLLTLSRFLGVTIDELFTEEGFTVKRKEGDISIVREEFEAHYYLDKSAVVITHGNKVEEFIAPSALTTVPEFVKFVDFLTQKF